MHKVVQRGLFDKSVRGWMSTFWKVCGKNKIKVKFPFQWNALTKKVGGGHV